MNGTEILIAELGSLSYFGIFIISILANVFIPFPEEVVLLGLGYLSGTGSANIWILIPIVITGLLVSDIGMYFLSRGGNKWVNMFYQKVFAGKLGDKLKWMNANINKVVFFSRFMVQLRFLGPFMAGQVKMPFKKFILIELAALFVYVPLFLGLGNYFHSRISSIIDGVNVVRNAILIFAGFVAIFAIFKILKKKLMKIFEKIMSNYEL
ncbi:MAG: DedA family protein [Candidatus Pacebacteria bacterium]|nr:DedA family protein [Candidatus Paceibacterota bacterium]